MTSPYPKAGRPVTEAGASAWHKWPAVDDGGDLDLPGATPGLAELDHLGLEQAEY